MRVLDRIDSWQQRHRAPAFVVGVVKKYGDDRGSQLAALITYYGFLALFPLLLVFVTVLGYVAHDDPGLRRDLLDTALADFPVVGQELRRNVGALGGNGLALAVGRLALIWGSLGVAQVAQHAMAQVWNVPGARRPGFGPRLVRSLLVLAVLGLAIVGTAALTTIATLVPGGSAVPIVSTVLVVVLNIGLYWLAFRLLTTTEIPWRDLLPGAVLGGVAWTALQALGGWLVARQLRHTSELYGTFGVVLGLLFFLYLAAQITVYAAEVNVVRARHLVPRSLAPPPLTDADEAVLTDVAAAEQRRPEEAVDVSFERQPG
ncbi:MAG TPA: YihY/virulence factor BrkB family protein [Acidimicrobiia bacterium]